MTTYVVPVPSTALESTASRVEYLLCRHCPSLNLNIHQSLSSKMRLLTLSSIFVLGLAAPGLAQNVTETAASTSFSPSPVETSVPEASGSPDEPVPGQGEYPAVQSWCEGGDNATYCPGPVRPNLPLGSCFQRRVRLTPLVVVAGCSGCPDFPG